MRLNLSVLGSKELKELHQAVEGERKRRGKKSPDKHDPSVWAIPKKALQGEQTVS